METILELTFFVSAFLLFYIYLGYPIALSILWSLFPRKEVRKQPIRPPLTMIVSCYNEEGVIREKLENCLSLDYPKDRLEVIVVSDASTDRTDEIVMEFADRKIQLIRQNQRMGKTPGLNLAVPYTKGEIIVFSDANAIYEPDSLVKLVENFADDRVGYVVGEARYRPEKSAAAKSENTYWQYEIFLKKMESDLHSIVGGDGAIYAIRKELYSSLLSTDINDFVNPIQIILKGYRGVYEPGAVCWEDAGGNFKKEFKRKTRIVNRSFAGLMRLKAVMNPLKTGLFSFEIISHKFLRWFAPVYILGLASSSLILSFYSILLYNWINLCIGTFILMASIGFLLSKRQNILSIFYYPYYFITVNLASAIGIYRCLKGDVEITWSTVRDA